MKPVAVTPWMLSLLLAWVAVGPCAATTPTSAAAGGSAPTRADLPRPDVAAVYTDPDNGAKAYHPRPGDNAQFRRGLNAALRRNPKNAGALIQRAYLLHASGDAEEGDRDFQRAIEITADDPVNRRRALWSLGWSAFNRGAHGDALAYWHQADTLHGGHAFWVPYTMAVGSWGIGDRDVAVDWYAAAVRSQPEWGSRAGMLDRTRHWRHPERNVLEAVFEAWSAGHARPVMPAESPQS